MEIIRDLRTLKAIAKKYNMEIDTDFKYIKSYDYKLSNIEYKNNIYKIKYFDGCFFPFIVK